jgi:hypothetical protein
MLATHEEQAMASVKLQSTVNKIDAWAKRNGKLN